MLLKACSEYYSLIFFCVTYSFAFLFFKFIKKKHFITILFAAISLPHLFLTMKNFMGFRLEYFKGLNFFFLFGVPALVLLILDNDERAEKETIKNYFMYLVPSIAIVISFFISGKFYFQMLMIMVYVIYFYLIFSSYLFSKLKFRKLIVCSSIFLLTINFFLQFFKGDTNTLVETSGFIVLIVGIIMSYFDFNRYEITTIIRWGMMIFLLIILIMMLILHFFFYFDYDKNVHYLDLLMLLVFFSVMIGIKKLFKNELDKIINPDRTDILLRLRGLIIRCMEFTDSEKMLKLFCEYIRRLFFIDWVAVVFTRPGCLIYGSSKGMSQKESEDLDFIAIRPEAIKKFTEDNGVILEILDKGEYSVSILLGQSKFKILDLRHISYIEFLLINIFSVLRKNDLVVKLQKSNSELVNTMKKLKDTQKKLISSERLAALGTMSGVVAHEIRNPLGTLKLSMNHLQHAMEDEELKDLVEMATAEIFRLDKMVDSLVEYSKNSQPNLVYFQPAPEINRIIKLHESNEEFTLNCELNEKLEILMDKDFFYQIFFNLFQNAVAAVKGMECCDIRIKLDIVLEENFNEYTSVGESENDLTKRPYLLVEDSGCGISEENLKKVFEPFYTTKTRGSGIGLAQVFKLLEISGSDLLIRSIPGKGTAVLCIFPLTSEE